MSLIDSVFRRDASPALAPSPSEQTTITPAARKPKKKQAAGFYYWNFFIHKWAGLIGAGWLAVLGLTGFFLDHDSWRWLMQSKAPAFLTPAALDANSARGVARLLQIDPNDRAIQVAGGPRGLWQSRDGGRSWTPTRFADGDHPQVLAIEPDAAKGWDRLWFATDNGLYASRDKGASARPVALTGDYVTALAAGASDGEMLAVIDKSRVLRFATDNPAETEALALQPLGPEARPVDVQVNRFVRELHFGHGVLDRLASLVMNDIGGLGMFILSLTGLLYWGLPKWWKHKSKAEGAASKAAKATRRSTIVWLFRLHSATLGIAAVLMLIYLSVTGIFIGHGRELGDWMRATRIAQAYLPPAFGGYWNGWVDSIVAYPGQPDAYTIGNRIGMFTTVDGGRSWAREEDAKGQPFNSASRLRRIGDKVLLSGGMAGPSIIRGVDQVDYEVAIADGDRRQRRGEGRRRREANAEGMGKTAGMDHARHSEMGGSAARDGDVVASQARPTPDQFGGMNGMEGMFMPSDVTRIGDNFAWKSSGKVFVTDAGGKEIEKFDIIQPSDPGTPWFSWILRLHMGTIFWAEWKWVNDVFAVLAIFLSVTGLIRWWRQKWM
jgi:hypothetical protein